MKIFKYIYITIAIAVGSAGLSGCEEDTGGVIPIPEPSDVEIQPQAVVTQSRAENMLSGAVDGTDFPKSTDHVFAVSAFLSKSDTRYDGEEVVYSNNPNDEAAQGIDTSVPYFLNQPIRTDETGAFHFDTENGPRYYPEDGSHVYFYAVSPACAKQDATDPKKVSWTLTGREDIMYARDVRGIRKVHGLDLDATHQPQPHFQFRHLLTRLNFRCRRETGFSDFIYIAFIQITDRNSVATLDLDKGLLSFLPPKKDIKYELKEPHEVEVVEGYNNVVSLMYEPDSSYEVTIGMKSGLTNTFTIHASSVNSTSGESNPDTDDTDNPIFRAGYSYNVNLRFQGVELKVDIALANWNDGGSTTGVIYLDN